MPLTPPPPSAVEFLTHLLLCSVGTEQNPSAAVKSCESAYRLKPIPLTIEELLNAAYLAGDKKTLEKLLKQLPDRPPFNLYRAEAKALLSLLEKNEEEFYRGGKEALRLGTRNDEILLQLFAAAARRGDLPTAVQSLEALYRLHPENEKIFLLLYSLSDDRKKIELLRERIQNTQPRESYYSELYRLLEKEGRKEEALKVLKEGAEVFSDLAELYAEVLLREGQIEEAFAEALPLLGEKRFYEIALKVAAERGDAALFRKIAEKLPDAADERLLLYLIIFNLDEPTIKKVGTILLKKKAASRETLNLYAAWLLLHGEKPSFPVDGSQPEGKVVEALLLTADGDLKGARRVLNETDEKKLEGFWRDLFDALKLYLQLKAGYDPDAAVKTSPPEAVLKSAHLLYRVDPDFSRKLLEAYTSRRSAPADFLRAFAVSYEAKDLPFGARLLKKAVELYPNDPELLNAYGYTLLLLKGKEAVVRACPLLERAHRLKPSAAITDSLAWCYYLGGNPQKAYNLLKTLNSEGEAVIEYHLAEVLKALGKPCEALRYAESSLKDLEKLPRPPEPNLKENLMRLKRELETLCRPQPKSNL
jgi:tetratricopeptide (TPR) repeat protein